MVRREIDDVDRQRQRDTHCCPLPLAASAHSGQSGAVVVLRIRVVFLAIAVVLIGCSSDSGSVLSDPGTRGVSASVEPSDQSSETSDPTTSGLGAVGETAVDGPVMRYPTPPSDDDGMAAEVRGMLQLDGECLYIYLDEAGERYPVLWPIGTRWDEQNQAVIPPAGSPMPVGSDVYGSGGYLSAADIERLAGSDAAALASSCVDNKYGEIAVVNNQPDAIALANG